MTSLLPSGPRCFTLNSFSREARFQKISGYLAVTNARSPRNEGARFQTFRGARFQTFRPISRLDSNLVRSFLTVQIVPSGVRIFFRQSLAE